MKTITHRILIMLIFLNATSVFGQTNFIIHGVIISSKTKLPVDTSVYVSVLTENKLSFQIFCNDKGEYSIHLPDSLNHKKVIVRALQDENKIKKYATGEPCSSTCIEEGAFFLSSNVEKFKLNIDSAKTYEVNFSLIPAIFDFSIPTVYFKKNESLMVQSDRYVSVDSAICDIKNLLKCRKTLVLELGGNCSPTEKNKRNLSLERAQVLREKLITMGINPERLIAKGNSDKHFTPKSADYEEWRPAHINKTDYEGQTVTFTVLRRDFQE